MTIIGTRIENQNRKFLDNLYLLIVEQFQSRVILMQFSKTASNVKRRRLSETASALVESSKPVMHVNWPTNQRPTTGIDKIDALDKHPEKKPVH
ncbi:hypothetical protein T07_13268 [Trichinella nelsoni]|uniref:Uncharacterized protein n=1 Tax=Trichinella nelsoni TaxID=6336 RepID=A0A0V0S1W0_9BILA|nr:hypothetical protein T07_13268 [Trichinella nelsoni]